MKPTLLEWLRKQSEANLKVLTGLGDVYPLMKELKMYGLTAFESLTADQQYYILSQYVMIYDDSQHQRLLGIIKNTQLGM